MSKKKTKSEYWVCIIGPVESPVPNGFDFIPRTAAIKAIMNVGFSQPQCWSGWGCSEKTVKKILNAWN